MKKVLVVASLVLFAAAGCNTQTAKNSDQQTSTTTPKKTAPAPSSSYTQALKTYGTNRIQYDQDCVAIPSQVAFKGGTKVMLDNRDDVAKKVTIGTTTYSLAAWGYKIATIPTYSAQKTIMGNCGAKVNVITIIVNK